MERLTKKDILRFLKKEGLLYGDIEEENDKGELEKTGIELKSLGSIIRMLHQKEVCVNNLVRVLKEKIKSNVGGYYYQLANGMLIRDKSFYFDKPVFFLDCGYLTFASNVFNGGVINPHEAMVTIAGNLTKSKKPKK